MNATPVIYPKYIATRKVFQSPFDKRAASEADNAPVSYGINANMYAASPGIAGNTTRVVSPSSTILMAPNYNGHSWCRRFMDGRCAQHLASIWLPEEARDDNWNATQVAAQINALFCDLHVETMTFGPAGTAGTFQDTTSDPLGLKHWDPTK